MSNKPIYTKWWFIVLSLFALLILAGIIKYAITPEEELKRMAAERQKEDSLAKIQHVADSIQQVEKEKDIQYRNSPHKFLDGEVIDWKMSGFGTVAMLNKYKLTNKGKYDVKDITAKFTFKSESGTELSSVDHTFYIVLKAGETKTITETNLGFVNKQSKIATSTIESAQAILDNTKK